MAGNGSKGTRRAQVRMSPSRVPDALIKIYFGLFPILVATFLSVQAVRANTARDAAQDALLIPAHYPALGIAR